MSNGYSRSTYFVMAFIVLVVVFWLWPNPVGKTIQVDPNFPGQEPTLSGVLSQPVVFRYAFSSKEPRQRSMEIHLATYEGKGHETHSPLDKKSPLALQRIVIEFEYQLIACDAKASCDLRLVVKRVRAHGRSGKHYDSDSKSAETQLAPLSYNALVNTPIPIRVQTSGKVEAIDLKPVKDKLGKLATPPVVQHLNALVQSLSNDLFVVFPENSLSLNDTFESPELSVSFADLAVLKISRKYKLKGVSADGQHLLLQTEMTPRLVVAEGAVKNPLAYTIKLEGAKTQGWVLYDIKAQDVLRSATEIEFYFSWSNLKEKSELVSTFKALYRTDTKKAN